MAATPDCGGVPTQPRCSFNTRAANTRAANTRAPATRGRPGATLQASPRHNRSHGAPSLGRSHWGALTGALSLGRSLWGDLVRGSRGPVSWAGLVGSPRGEPSWGALAGPAANGASVASTTQANGIDACEFCRGRRARFRDPAAVISVHAAERASSGARKQDRAAEMPTGSARRLCFRAARSPSLCGSKPAWRIGHMVTGLEANKPVTHLFSPSLLGLVCL